MSLFLRSTEKLPIRTTLKAEGLMRQLQRYGRVIQSHATSE